MGNACMQVAASYPAIDATTETTYLPTYPGIASCYIKDELSYFATQQGS